MESPKNNKGGGLESEGRRKFLRGLGAVAGAVALGSMSSKASAQSESGETSERPREQEKPKRELEDDLKVAEIEQDMIRQFNTEDIKNIMRGRPADGTSRLYLERRKTTLDAKMAGLLLPLGGVALGGLKGEVPGAILGGVAGGLAAGAFAGVTVLPKHAEVYFELAIREMQAWLAGAHAEGRFETEQSTKDTLQERYNALARKQNEIQKKLEKM